MTVSTKSYASVSKHRLMPVSGMRWLTNRLPHFPGKNRIARLFAQAILPKEVCLLNHVNQGTILLDMTNPHEVSMFYDTFDKKFSNLILETLRPGDTFIDCGANVGYFTLLAASLVKSNGCVFSFEPNPFCYERIEFSLQVGGYDNVRLRKGAVGEENTEMPFNVSEDPMYSSFSDVDQLSFASLEKTITVPVYTIDSSIEEHIDNNARVRLIKIDVEGAELEALHGMARSLERKAYDYIYVELHPQQLALRDIDINEVSALLESYGYRDANWGQPRRILYAAE